MVDVPCCENSPCTEETTPQVFAMEQEQDSQQFSEGGRGEVDLG